jgi:hypothetical protein
VIETRLAESASVRAAAERAADRFGWYRVMLDDAREPPILTEEVLAATYYASAPPAGEAVYATSGTTGGRPKLVGWPARDHERYVEARSNLFRTVIGEECATACADLGTGHAQASAREIFDRLGLDAFDIDVKTPVAEHVAQLRECTPDLLYTMPAILERICGAGGPGYAPKWIVVLGDVAPRPWRDAMAARLGMQRGHIVDVFGSIEIGAIGYSDDVNERYLFHEHIVPELLPDGGLALTSLERDGFPAVRYSSGDVVRGVREVCVDGRVRWAYDEHLGRSGTEIKHGEMLSLPLIAGCVASVAPGGEWSVERRGLEVVICLDEHTFNDEVAQRLRVCVRAAHPAVDAMIASGLVGDIAVEPRVFDAATSAAKRSISG